LGKKVIAFLDGDRAADLILKELHGLVNIHKVLRAAPEKEVEECTPLEISEILKELVEPAQDQQVTVHHQYPKSDRKQQSKYEPRDSEYRRPPNHDEKTNQMIESNPEILSTVKEVFPQINETLEAVVLDNSMKTLLKLPVSDIVKKLDTAEGGKLLVMDGIITQRLIDAADKVGIEFIVGHRTGELKKPTDINIITFSQMGIGN